ncbi:DEAD/DEAH box helicase [bacterium]|nr:DEAD/DEAH box helicase [bacterium]
MYEPPGLPRNYERTRLKKFSELGLAEPFLRSIDALGYERATPIQAQAIPVVLQGSDLVGCAQTGTGKTAAFTLPMLDRLLSSGSADSQSEQPRSKGSKGAKRRPRTIRALVLSPTRELAAQIGDSLTKYGKHTHHRHCVVFGGVSQMRQVRSLQRGVDIVVATPGRLLDLKGQGYIDLSTIEILVLDEADQMLDMGFLPALKQIVAAVPRERQTLMFSATMPPEIRKLASHWLTDPVNIEVAPVSTPAERIAQTVHMVPKGQKIDLLLKFLKETPRSRTLVFMRTKRDADKIVKILERDGLRAAAIHGNKSQGARTRTLEQFKGSRPPILVATDIAARGLDIRDVSHIVNFDLPETPETYVHRIGRTARAGAEGAAVSFCSNGERKLLAAIEKLMKCRIAVEYSGDQGEPRPKREQPRSDQPRNDQLRPEQQPAAKPARSRRPSNRKPRRPDQAGSNGGSKGKWRRKKSASAR